MIRLLSYFVINKQTPHIVLPITTFNTSIKPFLNLTKSNIVNNKKFEQFVERYEKGDYYQNVSILVSEWANGGDLLDYLRNNYKTMTVKSGNKYYNWLGVGMWRNTNAITSVTIEKTTNNMTAGSTFTLYGIAAA
jgi:hypothetical protein